MGLFKVVKTLRNNWKKTVFFTGVAVYGCDYGKKKYEDSLLRTAYCLEAKKYGDEPLKLGEKPRSVTVFLNPAARKGKGKTLFEKNVAPVLHLAGLEVTIIRTEYEGQAKKYMDVLEQTDAIVIAGGDGTVSEVITGLNRRKDEQTFTRIPIGVIPMGYTNTLCNTLLPGSTTDVGAMLEAAMAVVKGNTRPVDVIHVEAAENRSVCTATSLQWGSFVDARNRQKKYWYFVGGLKRYWTYVWTAVRHWSGSVQTRLTYIEPCEGCSRCYTPPPPVTWRWWHFFSPPKIQVPERDYSSVINERCGEERTCTVDTAQLSVNTCNSSQPHLPKEKRFMSIDIAPSNMTRTEFIKEGWRQVKEDTHSVEGSTSVHARQFSLQPLIEEGKEAWFSVDNDKFEVMPVQVQLLPHKLNVFCTDALTVQPVSLSIP